MKARLHIRLLHQLIRTSRRQQTSADLSHSHSHTFTSHVLQGGRSLITWWSPTPTLRPVSCGHAARPLVSRDSHAAIFGKLVTLGNTNTNTQQCTS